jgi:hypothetical protein
MRIESIKALSQALSPKHPDERTTFAVNNRALQTTSRENGEMERKGS